MQFAAGVAAVAAVAAGAVALFVVVLTWQTAVADAVVQGDATAEIVVAVDDIAETDVFAVAAASAAVAVASSFVVAVAAAAGDDKDAAAAALAAVGAAAVHHKLLQSTGRPVGDCLALVPAAMAANLFAV